MSTWWNYDSGRLIDPFPPPKMGQNVSRNCCTLVEAQEQNLELGFKLANIYHLRIYIPWLHTFTNNDAGTKMTLAEASLKEKTNKQL